jgi:hypothetical protein
VAAFVTLIASAPAVLHSQGQTPAAERVVEGTLEVLYEDAADTARLVYFLNSGTERIPLRFERNPPRLLHGSRVRARGRFESGVLALSDGSSSASFSPASLTTPFTFGVQSVIVILVNFSDLTTQPFTTATAQSVTFTDANNFDLENSFGQTSLTGEVTGWLTIASASTSCNYNTWATQADQAATNAGYNVAAYTRRIYAFPHTNACTWTGLGTIGGGTLVNPSRAWANGTYTLQVVAHEMGHNFGLYHSHSNVCDATGCTVNEYGDDHDVMGNYTTGHFNAFQKESLGWLNYGISPPIQTVTTVGPVTLEPYETASGGFPKALKILKSTLFGSNTYLYAEARTQTGIDATLTPGVVIHTGVDDDGNQSQLQDILPSTTSTKFVLDPGQSVTFTGDSGPITLTTLSADSGGAVVAYTHSAAPCTYSLGSSGQSIGASGGPGSVALTAQSDCYWSASSNANWITLNAGSTSGVGSATLQFTVAANAGAGRTGTLSVMGQTFTVTQAGTCSYTVSPIAQSFPNGGGTGTTTVTAAAGCTWTAASSNTSWLNVTSGASGSGNGTVGYSVSSQGTNAASRSATLTIAGQTVTIYEGKNVTSMSTAAASGVSGGTASLSATLTLSGSGLSGKTVTFRLNGTSVGTATTNTSGVASLSNVNLSGVATGTYPAGVAAAFAGDSTNSGSANTNSLTVTSNVVNTSLAAATATGAYGGTTAVSATLTACGAQRSIRKSDH